MKMLVAVILLIPSLFLLTAFSFSHNSQDTQITTEDILSSKTRIQSDLDNLVADLEARLKIVSAQIEILNNNIKQVRESQVGQEQNEFQLQTQQQKLDYYLSSEEYLKKTILFIKDNFKNQLKMSNSVNDLTELEAQVNDIKSKTSTQFILFFNLAV